MASLREKVIEAIAQAIVDEPGFEWQGLDEPDVLRHLEATAHDAAESAYETIEPLLAALRPTEE